MKGTHEEELMELFLRSTVTYSEDLDKQEIRLINFETFKTAVDIMMNKAYYYGKMENSGQVIL